MLSAKSILAGYLRAVAVVTAAAAAVDAFAGERLTGEMSNRENAFYARGADAWLELEACGFAPSATVKTRLTIHDEFEAELERRDISFGTDASGAWTGKVPLPTARYGFYRVRVTTESGTTLPKVGSRPKGCVTYAVCHAEAERKRLAPDDCFFGLFATAPHLAEWLGFHQLYGAQTPVPDPKEGAARLARRHADEAAGRFVRYGTVLPGNTFFLNKFASPEARKWLKSAAENRRETFALMKDPEGRRHLLETYAKFARAAREQFPDLRRIYECFLEPDINVDRPEQIVEAAAPIYETIKRVDPEAIVALPDLSTVMDVNYHRQLFDLGLAKHMDAFALHPYCPYPPEPSGFIGRLRETDALVEKAMGRKVEKFATEAGFATPATREGELLQMNGIVRKQLILLGEGYTFSYAFYPHDYGNDSGLDHDGDYGFTYNHSLAPSGQSTPAQRWGRKTISPRPAAPALSAAAWHLDGKRPVSCIDYLGGGTHGYAYADRNDDVVIALWDYSGADTEVDLPVGREVIGVSDHMGNVREVACAGGTLHLKLSEQPVYVLAPDAAIWGRRAKRSIRLADGDIEVPAGGTFIVRGKTDAAGEIELCANRALGNARVRRPCRAGAFEFRVDVPGGRAEGNYPVMVRFYGADGALGAIVGKGVLVRAPVAIGAVDPVCEGGVYGVRIAVENLSDRPQKVMVETRIRGVPEARREKPVACGARARREATLLFHGMSPDPFRTMEVEAATTLADGRRWRQKKKLNFLSADFVPNAGKGGDFTAWNTPVYRKAFDDMQIAFAWNERYLLVDARVEDDHFQNEQKKFYTWNGDSLQLALAGTVLDRSSSNNLRDLRAEAYTEHTIARTPQGDEVYRTVTFDPECFPAGVNGEGTVPADDVPRKIEVSERPGGGVTIRYRAAFPWRMMGRSQPPNAGESVWFAACVNDRDPNVPTLAQRHIFGFKAAAPKRFGRIILSR